MEKVKELILKEIPTVKEITFSKITKNNGVVYPACTIKDSNNNTSISKVVYYDENKSDEEIAASIIKTYLNDKAPNIDMDYIDKIFSDENLFLSKVKPMLVDPRRNSKLFETVFRRQKYEYGLDLAVIYYIDLGYGTIKVTKSHLNKFYSLSCRDLHKNAIKNIEYTIQSISDVLGGIPLPGTSIPIYVVSNKNHRYGASSMLSFSCMNKVKKMLNTDSLFILPSSIHEVLCIPAEGHTDVKDIQNFKQMIESINREVLSEDEFLSNNLYYYKDYSLRKI